MELWTTAHGKTILPVLVLMMVFSAVLRRLLGSKPLFIRMRVLQVIACILVVLEIGKQTLSFVRGYDLYNIPLHVCSLFIFVLPLMAFSNGKHRQQVGAVTSALCAAVSALMLIYPNLIYSAANIDGFFADYMNFHTVVFHNLVLLAFLLILALDLHPEDAPGDGKAVVWFTACYCLVAASMAQLLKTNFANFYSCNVPVFETLRASLQSTLGAGLTQLLYVLVVALLHILFIFGAYRLFRLLRGVTARPVTETKCASRIS